MTDGSTTGGSRVPTPSVIGIAGVAVAAIVVVAGLWAGHLEVGLLAAAATLGVTHAIEPDHVAGITALTHEAGDPKLSALVGGCFATGHVVLVVVWIAVATAVLGTTEFPAVYEQVGLVFVGVVLTALGLYLGASGARTLVHRHDHDHDGERHAHTHVHLPGRVSRWLSDRSVDHDHADGSAHFESTDHAHPDDTDHTHDHGALGYLKIGTVGALFTLSPPVSMIAFVTVAMGEHWTLVAGAVLAYAVAIVSTMALIGGGAGSLFKMTKAWGRTVHAASQVIASVVVLAIAAHLFSDLLPALLG
ncbi:hypothetical protein [Halococcoides cellulosivorans]|uniref:Nickel/cobalt efflux system n=1 Tax=Halococcoides cellulosivorans TaxID=1679096 RepID=A0A2R4WZD6_9EURY|nr:hypothetical protein [Halococcoides cellulosivorans]AWB26902.1 hypothetical protein HARCEL1_03825 [Halococcoides cellulosivorans]